MHGKIKANTRLPCIVRQIRPNGDIDLRSLIREVLGSGFHGEIVIPGYSSFVTSLIKLSFLSIHIEYPLAVHYSMSQMKN